MNELIDAIGRTAPYAVLGTLLGFAGLYLTLMFRRKESAQVYNMANERRVSAALEEIAAKHKLKLMEEEEFQSSGARKCSFTETKSAAESASGGEILARIAELEKHVKVLRQNSEDLRHINEMLLHEILQFVKDNGKKGN